MSSQTFAIKGYQVGEKLSEGGMGAVYKAIQLSVDRPVAIKVLKNQRSDSQTILRFRREAKILAQINSSNVVQVLDLISSKGVTYIVMELVTGSDLGQRYKRMGKLSESVALNFMEQSAIGLSEAHKKMIYHRDVKPTNLMLTLEGVIKVTDFGLAEDSTDSLLALPPGMTAGTPNYISPEQALSDPVDARSDIYSLAATFYHLVSGKPPFKGNSIREVIMARVVDDVVPLHKVAQGVSKGFSQLMSNMLDTDPQKRPQHMLKVIEMIGQLKMQSSDEVVEVKDKALVVDELLQKQQIRELNLIELSARTKLIDRRTLTKALDRQREFTASKKSAPLEKILLDEGMVRSEAFIRVRNKLDEQLQLNENKRMMDNLKNQMDEKSKTFKELQRMAENPEIAMFNYLEKLNIFSVDMITSMRAVVDKKELQDYEKALIKMCVDNKLIEEDQLRGISENQGNVTLSEFLVSESYLKNEELLALMDVQKVQSLEYFYSMEMLDSNISFKDHIDCPHCKKEMFADDDICKSCGKSRSQKHADKTRQYAANELDVIDESKVDNVDRKEWYVETIKGAAGPFSLRKIVEGVKLKKIQMSTKLRKGTKDSFRTAAKTPYVARVFGICHACGELRPKKKSPCPSCSAVE